MDPADGTDGDPKLAATAGRKQRQRRSPGPRLRRGRAVQDVRGSRPSRTTSTAGPSTSARPPRTACIRLKDWKQVDPLGHLALTQALFVYATDEGSKSGDHGGVQGSPLAHGRGHPPGVAGGGGPEDPYLAYHYEGHYCWGSNSVKGRWGRVLLMTIALGVTPASTTRPTASSSPDMSISSTAATRSRSATSRTWGKRGPTVRHRDLPPVVPRRLTALRRHAPAATGPLPGTWSAVPTSSSPWTGSARPTANRQ